MTRIKQAGPPVLVVVLIAGLVGYIIGCTRQQREVNEDWAVVLTRSGEDDSWRSVGIADKIYQQVVRRVLAMAPEWRGKAGAQRRCEFFLTLFGHENREPFESAYLELGRAPYSTIKRVGRFVSKQQLLPMLQRREYIEWRPLAILMLTQHADASARQLIESRFEDPRPERSRRQNHRCDRGRPGCRVPRKGDRGL